MPRPRVPFALARRVGIAAGCAIVLAGQPGWCLSPGTALGDYNHVRWTAKDGAPASVSSMAQTPDGWLWLGTPSGLYRFDGVAFTAFVPAEGPRLLSTQISELVAEPNGDLYIGYVANGLSVLHADGRLEHLAPATKDSPVATTYTLAVDIDRSLWAATIRGLRHFVNGRWVAIGPEHGVSNGPAYMVSLDHLGRLWMGNGTDLYQLDRHAGRFVKATPPATADGAENLGRYASMITSPDGRIWDADRDRFNVVADTGGLPRPPWVGQMEGHARGIFDRDGNLWALRCPVGVCLVSAASRTPAQRITPSAVAKGRLAEPWQLNSMAPSLVLEDREGDLWIGSSAGIERFRDNLMVPVRLPVAEGYFAVTPDADGAAWVFEARSKAAWHFDGASHLFTPVREGYVCATADPDGAVVLRRQGEVITHRQGRTQRVQLPAAWKTASVRLPNHCALDDGTRIWPFAQGYLGYAWDGASWREADASLNSEASHFRAVGKRGQIWWGTDSGRLLLIDHGVRTEFSQVALQEVGNVLYVASSPEVVVMGEAGVAVMREGHFRRLRASRNDVLRNVTGLYVDENGTRWLNGKAGLLRIEAQAWNRATDAGAALQYELIDALDGYTGEAQVYPRMNTLGKVGDMLWVGTSSGIMQIDPRRRERNAIAPHPVILALNGDGIDYPLSQPVELRPGTLRLRFDFTAPALRKPERIVFSYWLDGVDGSRQTGSERSAIYTGLAPGTYRFHVRAMNEDGVWSKEEGMLELRVAPTLVQSVHFKLAIALSAFLLLWFLMRLRLRFLTRTLTERLRAQIAERERIARELHDTMLQTFQSVVLKVRAVASDIEPGSPGRIELEHCAHDANAAIEEGRDMVKALREAPSRRGSLEDRLNELGTQQAASDQCFILRRVGDARPLQPVVEQELFAIGREALRNAFRHAQAAHLEVSVEYGRRALVLMVRDDGRGIAPDAMDRPGHWGLRGIQERARGIHAEARLQTAPGAGTTWRVEVRAALAYVEPALSWYARLKRLWKHGPL